MAFASPPFRDPLVVPDSTHPLTPKLPQFRIGKGWMRYLSALVLSVDERPERKAHVSLSAQSASIATTPIPIGLIGRGLWRVTVHVRVTTAATMNSEIQATLSWTDGGVAQTESTSNLTGNTTTTREGMTSVIRVDANTPISYATTYSSSGATGMEYAIDVAAELIAADTV